MSAQKPVEAWAVVFTKLPDPEDVVLCHTKLRASLLGRLPDTKVVHLIEKHPSMYRKVTEVVEAASSKLDVKKLNAETANLVRVEVTGYNAGLAEAVRILEEEFQRSTTRQLDRTSPMGRLANRLIAKIKLSCREAL